MKIDYLELKNFSNIKTAFKSNKISIDFTKSKNKIILFTGPNGSGKTSILSCLHPFAKNGNLDVRNDIPLVLEGKDGYKQIIISNGNDTYVIQHYYTPTNKSHTIKSYLKKNGLELNPNGNVTSFKELIKDELNIEEDYLKLTRLGSNVTNFIDLKTTDRKGFMGKILDEVDIYLKYHKKLTNDMRELKTVISHLIDKIDKLNVYDKDELKKSQKQVKKSIDEYKGKIDEINSDISVLNYEISKYDSPLVLKESLYMKQKELDKIYKILSKDTTTDISKCDEIINGLKVSLAEDKLKLGIELDKRSGVLNQLDDMIGECKLIDKELDKIENSSDVKDTEYMITELRKTIERRSSENDIIDFHPSYTKDDVSDLIVSLDKAMDILYNTFEFGKGPISKAIEFILAGDDVSTYVSSFREKVTKNKLQSAAEYLYNTLKGKYNTDLNCNTKSNCPMANFYNDISDLATEVPDVVIEDETFVACTKLAYQNIKAVIRIIQSQKDILSKLPKNIQEMFILKTFLNKISNLECIYDKSELYGVLSKITEYELQQQDLKQLDELKDKLTLLKKSIGNSEYFETKKNKLLVDIEEYRDAIEDMHNHISELQTKISNNQSSIDELEALKESLEKRDLVENEFVQLSESYDNLTKYITELKSKTSELEQLNFVFNKLSKEYNENDYRLRSYDTLTEELSGYNERYDEMELVKSSLSAKDGIPLLFIEVYLKNTQDITNELLEIVYDGDLSIDKFNITADEFKIPYTKGETTIDDVCYASQGERSFITLALSFALTYQSISEYNIMLLDEVDATLDTSNREKFLQILEKQMDMIDAEQVFVISHNNMFNMYPVDIINMKNGIDKDNRLANYIKINVE